MNIEASNPTPTDCGLVEVLVTVDRVRDSVYLTADGQRAGDCIADWLGDELASWAEGQDDPQTARAEIVAAAKEVLPC